MDWVYTKKYSRQSVIGFGTFFDNAVCISLHLMLWQEK